MRPLLALVLAAAASPAFAQSEEDLRRWSLELGADEYRVREEAYQALWKAGRVAIPHLETAAGSSDLETRTRASRLLPLVRWEIQPALLSALGDRILGYDLAEPEARLSIVLAASAAPIEASVRFLEAVVESEPSEKVWRQAFERLEAAGTRDLVGWLEGLVASGRAGARVYAVLAERLAGLPPGPESTRRIVRSAERLLARAKPFDDPEVYLGWTSAALSVEREDLAEAMIEAALDSRALDPWSRLEMTSRLLERDRVEQARDLLDLEGADAETIGAIVDRWLAHGYPDEAWRAASAAMAARPDDLDLRVVLAEVFEGSAELDRAASIAGSNARSWHLRLDEGAAIGALRANPGDGLALARELLHFGRGEEALEVLRARGEPAEPEHVVLVLLAAVQAGDATAAAGAADRATHAWNDGKIPLDSERSLARARVEAWLAAGRTLGLEAVCEPLQGREDSFDLLLAAYAGGASADWFRSVPGDPETAHPSRAFESRFARGQIAEREGDPSLALHEYARALVASWTGGGLAWHRSEIFRKATYLVKVPGAVEAALERTRAIEDARERFRVGAALDELAGDPAAAARRYDPRTAISAPEDEAIDRFDTARRLLAAGEPDRAVALIEPLRRRGGRNGWGRAALRLSLRAAAASPEAEAWREALATGPEPSIAAWSAQQLMIRGLDDEALAEWDAALATHRTDDEAIVARASAHEYRALLLERRDGPSEASSGSLLRALQLGWVHGLDFVELGGEAGYRARLELARAHAVAGTDARAAALHLKKALAHAPRSIEAALRLAEVAREIGDDAAARAALERAIRGLARQVELEPANPAARERLAHAESLRR